jgi:hypothetical protein
MGRVSIAISVQSLSRSYAHTVIHSDESLFLDQTCAGVVVFSGCLPSFRRQSSDLRHTCPQSETSFLPRSSEIGMLRTQSRDCRPGSNVPLRPNTCTAAAKSLNRFQPTLRGGGRTGINYEARYRRSRPVSSVTWWLNSVGLYAEQGKVVKQISQGAHRNLAGKVAVSA